MGKYGDIQQDFYAERGRILEALGQPENREIIARLIGALAFRTHCPQYGYIQDALGREFTDIDFVSYSRCFQGLQRLFAELGYRENKMVTQLFGESRLIFDDPVYGRHIDVFFDKLEFCHVIPLRGRLEVDSPTIPLAELLLEKMQIVRLNEKDLIDSIMLLREHPVGDEDHETINARVIAALTARDWGLWRTVTGNLRFVADYLPRYPQLSEEDRQVVAQRIAQLLERIAAEPKSTRWKLRGLIGERVRWYKNVEELERYNLGGPAEAQEQGEV